MGDDDDVRIEVLGDREDAQVRGMLVDLALAEQRHFDHPPETTDQLSARLATAPRFTGENHLLVARSSDGAAIGLCWVVLFDPGTGLEAEIAVPASGDPDADDRAAPLPPVDDALDMGAAIAQTAAARGARRTAPFAIAALALFVFWRRRR